MSPSEASDLIQNKKNFVRNLFDRFIPDLFYSLAHILLVVSQEWLIRLTWNKKDRLNAGPTFHLTYDHNLPCDWPSTAWAYFEQETERGPRWCSELRFSEL